MVQFAVDVPHAHTQIHEFHARGWRRVAQRRAGGTALVAAALTADRFLTYSARKPYVVAERLEELRGPTAGTVSLPPHLDWSGNATYDLGKPARLASMYRSVLNEAASAEDLRTWLHARLLVQLWPTLWLPSALRRAWEDHFPEFSALRG